MKKYECCWCSIETNDDEEGGLVLESGEDMLCPACARDQEIQRYLKPVELKRLEAKANPCAEIKTPKSVCPVIDIQEFEDVLNALRITYGGHGIGIKGDNKLLRLFLDMSECVDNT